MAGKEADGGLRSYASMTYAGLKSMIYAGLSREDPRVKAAFTYISHHYSVDENPGLGQQGLYYYYHTFAKTMSVLETPTITDAAGVSHDWRSELISALAKRQQPNGSWVNPADRFMEGDPNLVTAYALWHSPILATRGSEDSMIKMCLLTSSKEGRHLQCLADAEELRSVTVLLEFRGPNSGANQGRSREPVDGSVKEFRNPKLSRRLCPLPRREVPLMMKHGLCSIPTWFSTCFVTGFPFQQPPSRSGIASPDQSYLQASSPRA